MVSIFHSLPESHLNQSDHLLNQFKLKVFPKTVAVTFTVSSGTKYDPVVQETPIFSVSLDFIGLGVTNTEN